jgi:hypothetical protein
MRQRAWAVGVVLALMSAGCGARHSTANRQLALKAALGQGNGSSSASSTRAAVEGTTADDSTAAGATSGDATTAGATSSAGGGTTGAAGTSGGTSAGPGGSVGTAIGGGANGGASDVGVTGDRVVLANISSISGISPGLFKTAQVATKAYAAMVNAGGGLFGRRLDVLAMDSKLDASEDRLRAIQACKDAFAQVGSAEAFDDGGAPETAKCKMPDIRAFAATGGRAESATTFAASAVQSRRYPLGWPKYIARTHPQAIKNTAIFWISAATTEATKNRMKKAYESVGFKFVYEQAVQVVEANFAPYVVEMRRRGVTDVMMVSDVGTQSRLQDAMRQQAFKPEVQDWLSTAYDPAYIVRNGANAEGTFVQMTTAMLEEADKIPEVAKYLQWADRVDPGGRRDIYGLLGWSASMMFVEGLKAIGPKPTRAAMLGWLNKLHHWDGGGVGPAVDPAGRLPTDCYMYTTVKNGKFVRLWPQGGGFACGEAGTVDVSKI